MSDILQSDRPATLDRTSVPDGRQIHDEWSGFEAEVTHFDGVIIDNNIDGSDPTLQVRARDGVNWTIELAGHRRNLESGLTSAQALPGDAVSVVGRCTRHFGENRIKAMHLTIGLHEFGLFPDCLPA